MLQPLVSVAIPAYNHEAYVRQAITSVINQTYQRLELIIIDDGSQDNTWSVIQDMREVCESRFERFIMQTQQNQGSCNTCTSLLSLCNGEYVALIASDDMYTPVAIERMVKTLEYATDAVLVVGINTIMDSDGRQAYWDAEHNIVYDKKQAAYTSFSDSIHKNSPPLDAADWGTYSALIKGNHIPNGYLIRRAALTDIVPFTPEAPLEDWWLMMQLSKKGRFINIDEPTFMYRWHSSNTMHQKEKIQKYGSLTLEWEEHSLRQSNDAKHWEIFKQAYTSLKVYLNLGIIKFFRRRIGKLERLMIFQIGSKEIILSRRLKKINRKHK